MIYTRDGERYRVVIGLDGGCHVTVWRDEMDRRHGTPTWVVVPANENSNDKKESRNGHP